MRDPFMGIKDLIDTRLNATDEYITRVVSKNRVLDIGGRNSTSLSRKTINKYNKNPNNTIISTDILAEYNPDLVDDICNTTISPNSFDGVFCDAVLEHVTEYWKAVDNIHTILEDGGEAFISVPFIHCFHDQMDHHRFTFTEVARMLQKFSEVKVFTNRYAGFGHVLWYMLTFTTISKFPKLHKSLARMTNFMLKPPLYLAYKLKSPECSFEDLCYFYTYLFINGSFCAWVKK